MAEMWELTREVTWEVIQASSSIPLHSLKERRMFVGDLQFAEKDTSLVPPIHKFRKLRNSSPTHNNNNSTAEGYSELLHCPEGHHRDGSPDGQLQVSLHQDRQTGGMYCTHLICALPNDLQKEIGKRVLANEKFTPWFLSQKSSYNRAISKGKKNLVFFPEEVWK